MSQCFIRELPYHADSADLLRRLSTLRGRAFLDGSGAGPGQDGRYDILSALPATCLRQQATTILRDEQPIPPTIDIFSAVDAALQEFQGSGPEPDLKNLPFQGGAIGWFGYRDAAVVGIYLWAIIVDHHRQHTLLFALPHCAPDTLQQVQSCLEAATVTVGSFSLTSALVSNFDAQSYAEAFARVQAYIHAGDCYQVNLAQRFSATWQGDPLAAYLHLRQHIHSPFSAYLPHDRGAVLSFSPERFLQLRGGQVLTQPIKGTRRRSPDPGQDTALASELESSAKDRAENLMIVDLLRNDLGTLCEIGSVRVEKLFELRSFTNVHHLVSSVHGRLGPQHSALALLRNCFPGGSITGAPKRRAMQIIDELEPDARNVYCGSIGYIGFDRQMDTNIAIRTLQCDDDAIHCWGGGGIVADSECGAEYQEGIDKISNIIKLLDM